MGGVTAVGMDCITEKSGHSVTPMAVSVCLTPAAPAPLPIPYPVVATSIEGIGDAPMRTKISGALIGTVGSVLKTCHGNEPGTLKEVVSLNTAGPCFIVMGAPVVLVELGMMGITGSLCMQNKAPTPGAGGSASDASGTGGAGGGGGEGSGSGGDASGPGGPAGGGGAGGGGSNSGAAGPGSSSGTEDEHQCQNGHPIDVATGYVVDTATDLSLPGAIPLVWKRMYSSSRRGDAQATLGPGWAHPLEQWIVEEERTTTLRDGQGRFIYFARIAPREAFFHRRERMTLSRDADGSYRVHAVATRLTSVFSPALEGGPSLLRSIRDAWDNAITLTYEGPRLARVIDTAGRELRAVWKANRLARLEVRAEGRLEQWVDYGYSTAGCLTSATDALGGTEEYEYDRYHRMTAAVVKTGLRFEYEYEVGTGRCTRTRGPNGLYSVDLTFDRAARTTRTDSEEPRLYTWNDLGLTTREETPDGEVIEETAYDADGLLVAEVNGAGEGTQYWYDQRGNQTRTVDAEGNVASIEYEHDRPCKYVMADGQTTLLMYDDKGSRTGITYPSGEHFSLGYDARGHLTSIAARGGLFQSFAHDAQHNLVVETDARGARTTHVYDSMGRVVASTDALDRTTRFTYDRLGRPIQTRASNGAMTMMAYDAMGNVVREVDTRGDVTLMEYAGLGMISRITEPGGRQWTFEYTSNERLARIKNPRGEAYTFTYDDAGRVSHEKPFDGREIAYLYSAAGRLARLSYPDHSYRAFSHDRLGHLVAEETPDGTITAHRDRLGRLLELTLDERTGRVVTRFERDAFGRITAETQGDHRVRHTYDQRNRPTSRTLPDGARTDFTYDADGALVGVEHAGRKLVLARDVLGREASRSDGEGRFAIHSAHDGADRLIEQRVAAPQPGGVVPAILVQRQWSYDPVGRLKRVDDARWGATTYQYDRAGLLVGADRGPRREALRYDIAGSLLKMLDTLDPTPPGAEPEEIAPGNLLLRTPRAKYRYDKLCRRIEKIDLPASAEAGEPRVTRYVWDSRDRLREVALPSGVKVLMQYDALGRRVRKEVLSSAEAQPRITEQIWDGETLAVEIDSQRGARSFVHEPGTMIPLLQIERGEVFACVNDHLGTPRELIDAHGLVAWAAAYSVWGRVVETHADPRSELNRGRKVDSPFRLLGQIADDDTGLCWTRFRCFDPAVGRWCTPDPLGYDGGKDLFGFDGNPTNDVDPLGLAKDIARGPGGAKKHNPGKAHRNAVSEASTKKDFAKKIAREKADLEARRAAAQAKWDAMKPEVRKMLPELHPDKVK